MPLQQGFTRFHGIVLDGVTAREFRNMEKRLRSRIDCGHYTIAQQILLEIKQYAGDYEVYRQVFEAIRLDAKRYEATCDDDIKAKLWKWLSRCSVRTKDKLVSCQPSRALVTGVMDALKAVANQSSSMESPCWLSHGPDQVIAFDNGLLDVDGFLKSGNSELMDHTPQWFSSNCLPHRFDVSASCPQWLEFLGEVFDGDQERIDTLGQWFGYNLIADNRQHKIAMLIGPPRSGKGTTIAVMSTMLGKHNIANTSLASLGGRFGLEPLVGKLSALIDEGHLGKFSDTSQILERLKAISGGSEQTVDRKGVAALSSVALWATFNQWKQMGGQVKRRPAHVPAGKWGTQIVFSAPVTKKKKSDDDEEKTFFLLRSFTVFCLDQVDGPFDHLRPQQPEPTKLFENFEAGDELIAATGADIRTGNLACYVPSGDYIVMPPRESFYSAPEYYETAFHELTHWTEHSSRLNWDRKGESYAMGELIAEISANYLATELGIPNSERIEQSSAYIKGWLECLKGDNRAIFRACSQASKAAGFLKEFVRTPEPAEVTA